MAENRLELAGICKNFGAVAALRGVDLTLAAGRSMALIGPTAAGKSVLLKIIAGVYAPSSGVIKIDGEILSAKRRRQHIGMLFQHNALFDSLPIWENISFSLLSGGASRVEARARAAEILPRVGLAASVADLFPADLSGGMQKRVGFARAIISSPDILLLDNPTAGLDPILAARIEAMIGEYVRETKASVVAVSSSMNIGGARITELYDEIAVLADAVLHWQASGAETAASDNAWAKQMLSGARDGPIKTRTKEAA